MRDVQMSQRENIGVLYVKKRFILLVGIGIVACQTAPEGLRLSPAGTGPTVVVDWDAHPFPDVPAFNNLATAQIRTHPRDEG